MTEPPSIVTRFQGLPRAVRWLAFAVVFVVLFRAWEASVGSVAAEWNAEADDLERRVQVVRESKAMLTDLQRLDDMIVALGPVQLPDREAQGRLALNDAVVGVLKNYDVSDMSFDLSGGGDRLRETVSRTIVGTGKRLMRLSATLKFEASPEDTIDVISELESRPEVECISKVRLIKSSGRKVKANLTLEAWVEAPSRRKR